MKALKKPFLKAVLVMGALALFPAAFSQELEGASAQETPSVDPSLTPTLEQASFEINEASEEIPAASQTQATALPELSGQVQEVMVAIVSGNVQELVDLSSELVPTQNAIAENIDESFLHFQGINDLLSIPSAPIVTVAVESHSNTTMIGEGKTTNGEPCLIEREQLASLNSKNNPYAKSVLLRMTILSRSGILTRMSVTLDEDDPDFRIHTYARETDPQKIDRETLNIEATRVSQVTGAEPKMLRSEISATLELQKLRALRIASEWQNENSSLQIKSDASCLNIKSESKASKVFANAL